MIDLYTWEGNCVICVKLGYLINPRPTKPFFCNMVYQGGSYHPLMNLKLTGPKYDCLVPWYRVGSPLYIDRTQKADFQ